MNLFLCINDINAKFFLKDPKYLNLGEMSFYHTYLGYLQVLGNIIVLFCSRTFLIIKSKYFVNYYLPRYEVEIKTRALENKSFLFCKRPHGVNFWRKYDTRNITIMSEMSRIW